MLVPGYYVTKTEIVVELGEEHCTSEDLAYFSSKVFADEYAEDYVRTILDYGYPSFFGNSLMPILSNDGWYEISDETNTRFIRICIEHRSLENGQLIPDAGYRIVKVYSNGTRVLAEEEVGYCKSMYAAEHFTKSIANKIISQREKFFGTSRDLYYDEYSHTIKDPHSSKVIYFDIYPDADEPAM